MHLQNRHSDYKQSYANIVQMHRKAYNVQYAPPHQAGGIVATHDMAINAAMELYRRASETTYHTHVSVVLTRDAAWLMDTDRSVQGLCMRL